MIQRNLWPLKWGKFSLLRIRGLALITFLSSSIMVFLADLVSPYEASKGCSLLNTVHTETVTVIRKIHHNAKSNASELWHTIPYIAKRQQQNHVFEEIFIMLLKNFKILHEDFVSLGVILADNWKAIQYAKKAMKHGLRKGYQLPIQCL